MPLRGVLLAVVESFSRWRQPEREMLRWSRQKKNQRNQSSGSREAGITQDPEVARNEKTQPLQHRDPQPMFRRRPEFDRKSVDYVSRRRLRTCGGMAAKRPAVGTVPGSETRYAPVISAYAPAPPAESIRWKSASEAQSTGASPGGPRARIYDKAKC